MNPTHFSPLILNLFILILFLLSYNSIEAVDKFYQTCSVPKTCGDNQNITFPFYIQGLQEPYCGYPGFQLSCNNNGHPILNLSNESYTIHKIFYQNQSLIVSNSALSNPQTDCIPFVQNLTLSVDYPLQITPNQSQVILLYNCNSSLLKAFPKYNDIGCSVENRTRKIVGLSEKDITQMGNNVSKCGKENLVVAPVMSYNLGDDENEINIREILNRGFLMKWTASNCSFCERSGGRCGFDRFNFLFKCYCPDRPHSARCDPLHHGDKRLGLKLGLGIGCSVFVLCPLIFLLWRSYKKAHSSSNTISRNCSDPYSNSDLEGGGYYLGIPVFSYHDLEEATHNFDSKRELGDGGFGTVYYGILKDGREVAVKRLYEHNCKRLQQFLNEIVILTRLRHNNLVSLYGCTSRHSRELLLVYEYIPNGTVADHLHGDRAKIGSLTWPIRMSIAIETATALRYLHASDIIHRDIKTNNILLDNNFNVKIADFGLSRLFPNDVTHISTAPQGTPGYVDPSYHQCYQLTSKSDVYSFGVVLVELISSMPAVDITRHTHEISLANLAINKIQTSAINEMVDPSLGFETDDEVRRKIIAFSELAFQCLHQDKEVRPSMEKVLEDLKRIRSGKNESDTENEEEPYDNFEVTENVQPPPSPDCDGISLLKNIKPPTSPISVTQNWPSSISTTPNVSS